MFRKIAIVVAVSILALSPAAYAKKAGMVDSKRGYGLAGCGLGSMLFGAKEGGIQIIASTTNGTSANQMFGITFGTLNCDIPEMGMRAALYIESNREVVMKEAARGEGQTLAGLATFFQCKDFAAFGTQMKGNFETIFVESDNAYTNVKQIMNTIQTSDLKDSCGQNS